MALPGKSSAILRKIVNTLVNITCEGKHVSVLYGCVSEGVVCSGQGYCNDHSCTCNKYYEGTYCEIKSANSSSSHMDIILGTVIGTTSTSPSCLTSLINTHFG